MEENDQRNQSNYSNVFVPESIEFMASSTWSAGAGATGTTGTGTGIICIALAGSTTIAGRSLRASF